jgi:hypothetical protein
MLVCVVHVCVCVCVCVSVCVSVCVVSVLYFPSLNIVPSNVYGQNGVFTTFSANLGLSVSVNGFNNPYAVALDFEGGLYVSDAANHRILYFLPGSTTPTKVYGQTGSFTTASVPNPPSATTLNYPRGLLLDSMNGLYVAGEQE